MIPFDQKNEGLTFYAPTHSYAFDGIPLTSVTTLIKLYSPGFDFEAEIQKVLKTHGRSASESVSRSWKESADIGKNRGSDVHGFIEESMQHRSPAIDQGDPDYKLKLAAMKYFVHKGLLGGAYVKLIAEQMVYHPDYMIAGTIDLVALKGHQVELYDWKTNKRIRKLGEGQYMHSPISHKPYCEMVVYSLQLNIYKIILEETYGVEVSKMFLVHLKSSGYPEEIIIRHYPEAREIMDHFSSLY